MTASTVPPTLDLRVNSVRFLAVDMVQKAGSGHPGVPRGAACMAYALWDRALKNTPCDPDWSARDMSAPHIDNVGFPVYNICRAATLARRRAGQPA